MNEVAFRLGPINMFRMLLNWSTIFSSNILVVSNCIRVCIYLEPKGFGVWGLGFGVWGLGDRKSVV